MANIIKKLKYRCDNDCEISGCPEHEATLHFNSITNTYFFDDGNGRYIGLDISSANVLVQLIKSIGESRIDALQI